jgi:hypothetical protein
MKNKTCTAGRIARLLGIAAILWLSVFSLDAFQYGDTVLLKIAAFGIHMIPSIILTLIMVIAWKYELTGGILFLLAGIGSAPYLYQLNFTRTQSVAISLEVVAILSLPFVITGILFLRSYFRMKRISLLL